MRNAGQTQAGIKIAWRNINNLRHADDTTLMAESEEELKSLLMKVKEGSENPREEHRGFPAPPPLSPFSPPDLDRRVDSPALSGSPILSLLLHVPRDLNFLLLCFLPSATFTVYSFILTISLQNTHPPHCPLISRTLLFSSCFYFSQLLCLLTPLAHTFRVGGMK